MFKYACYEILCFFRISSIHIPLVNLTDLCKKFGTCWHTCAKTCAKSTIFQICLYEAKLNGNNLNYIYNFHKFQLFPIVSVLLSSIWVCCSYFPMQYIYLRLMLLCISLNISVLCGLCCIVWNLEGTVWGQHFYKETNKIYKYALFFRFLAYLCFVAWLNNL